LKLSDATKTLADIQKTLTDVVSEAQETKFKGGDMDW
jgi:hypothetical protein